MVDHVLAHVPRMYSPPNKQAVPLTFPRTTSPDWAVPGDVMSNQGLWQLYPGLHANDISLLASCINNMVVLGKATGSASDQKRDVM